MFEEKSQSINERQKLFIMRERLRRDMMRTKPGETICLNFEQVTMLLKWLKELENTVKEQEERRRKYGIKKA